MKYKTMSISKYEQFILGVWILFGYLLMCLDVLGVIFPDTNDSLFNKTAFMTPRKVHIVNRIK